MSEELRMIFKRGSTTYYNSSLFFPKKVREDVTKLYAFVRVFDDLVDTIPQKKEEFYKLRELYYKELIGENSNHVVIKNFVELMKRKGFEEEWVEAFLNAMEKDMYKNVYYTLDETIDYMYGSAEVVGLMMMKILGLPEESSHYARMLGRSMQYLNFIRDVKEDLYLGRQYLPFNEMKEFGLQNLCECNSKFKEFIRFQVERYFEFQREAEKGYKYIPNRYLVPIKTASDMYKWTGLRIYHNPCIILSVKVKPKKRRIVSSVMKNFLGVYAWRSLSSFLDLLTLK